MPSSTCEVGKETQQYRESCGGSNTIISTYGCTTFKQEKDFKILPCTQSKRPGICKKQPKWQSQRPLIERCTQSNDIMFRGLGEENIGLFTCEAYKYALGLHIKN